MANEQQELLDLAARLQNGVSKPGTPEFVRDATRYKELRGMGIGNEPAAATPAAPAVAPAVPGPASSPPTAYDRAPPPPAATPPSDPYSRGNVAGRVGISALTAVPDMLAAAWNYGLTKKAIDAVSPFITGKIEPVTPTLPDTSQTIRHATGVADLPADAPTGQRLAEAGMSALIPIGPSFIRGLQAAPTVARAVTSTLGNIGRNVVAPTIGGEAGGAVGEYVGGKVGLPEQGRTIGSFVGGVGSQQGANRYGPRAGDYFFGSPGPNAPQIAATAARQGVTPTAGMLGDRPTQAAERNMQGQFGSAQPTIRARDASIEQIQDAGNRATQGFYGIPAPTPRTRDVVLAARNAPTPADASSAAQQTLVNKVGARSPVDVTPLLAEMQRVIRSTDPQTAGPIQARIDHLQEMMPRIRNSQGQLVPIPVVPYEQFKDWRTNLRAKTATLDGISGRFHDQIYDTATDAMRNTAQANGVHPDEFNVAQQITRNFHTGQALGEQMQGSLQQDKAANMRQFARWHERLPPEEQQRFGPQVADVARLADRIDYPTSTAGLGRAINATVTSPATLSALGGTIGHWLGSQVGLPPGFGAAVGAGIAPAASAARARTMQSDYMRGRMTNPPVQPQRTDRLSQIGDLIAAMNASSQAGQPRRGPRRDEGYR